MLSSGAKIDLKRLEEEIRQEIEEKTKRLFTKEELEELKQLELNVIPNPDRIRAYFTGKLEFPSKLKRVKINLPALKLPDRKDYNIDLSTFLASSPGFGGRLIVRLRNWFRPFFRLYGNIDAVIHKQAILNREQRDLNVELYQQFFQSVENLHDGYEKLCDLVEQSEKPYHYIQVLHTLVNYLVAELTKLNLDHQLLKGQVEALSYDLEQLRKRERLLERSVRSEQ